MLARHLQPTIEAALERLAALLRKLGKAGGEKGKRRSSKP